MEVLSVASEAYPLIKTGGLADVVGALPAALAPHGVSMRVLLPGYPKVMAGLADGRQVLWFEDFFGGTARLVAGRANGLDVIAIDAPHLYDRPGNPYVGPDGKDWPDNWQRFAALSFAAYELSRGAIEGYKPDILHCHDWQSGLAPAYVAFNAPTRVKTVMTVHNIAFQGVFGWDVFNGLRLDYQAANTGAIEYFGNIGYLKAGLQVADAVTTVSPTYAHEMRTAAYGMGLEGLLQSRADTVSGILNGIDANEWNPGTDAALAQVYTPSNIFERAANKRALEQRFGLDAGDGPIFSVVSRLTWQKGLDMLPAQIDSLVAHGGRLIVLGSGDAEIENGFAGAALRHPGKVGVVIGYDERLSHLIQGGADAILIPSRFEPCGLTQLYGLRYGCIPVVSRVGGLADTVIDANEAAVEAGVATGVVFSPATEEALGEAIRRTVALYARPKVWHKMQRRGMKSDVSWELSAEKYADLYASLLGHKLDDDSDD
ncbi:MAG TPA: glycogen synthase GlgA [Devosia sp.]|uniref:glycogen synthase GlgA n=1 Tax=Devosia sp. TaxID=1871048 RepID=UPI002DDCD380|nr:glycogen synthase GlgA [Devosia sp.]HEV2518593.1 glycogen synthase GlgA [Devosia sp.]